MAEDYPIKEIVKDVSLKSVLRLISLIVFFLFLFNWTTYYYLRLNTPNLGYKVIAKKWELLGKMNEKKNWIILGDSTCNQGLSISVFEEENSIEAVNLCTLGDMLTVDDSWILEKYIEKFGSPENVLVIHAYDMWYRDEVDFNLTSQIPLISLIKSQPNPWVFSKKDILTLFLYKYFPLYSEKSSLLETIVGFFQKEALQGKVVFDDDGFMSMEHANPEWVAVSVAGHKDFVRKNKFSMSSKNLAGLNSIRNMAERYGFNVFIANSPVNSELFSDEYFRNYFFSVNDYLKGFAKKSDRIYYINNFSVFPANQMISSDHIITSASSKYSRDISKEIKKARETTEK